MHTPRKAAVCCALLLILAFVKNLDLCFIFSYATNSSDKVVCDIPVRSVDYILNCRPLINIALNTAMPSCIVLACNWAIVRQLLRNQMPTAVRESVTRTTLMCLGVSFAFIVCVVPIDVVIVIDRYWPMTSPIMDVVIGCLILLRYVNHTINFFLFSLTSGHFRSELVALFRSCIQRGLAAAAVARGMSSRVTGRFTFQRGFEEQLEMR